MVKPGWSFTAIAPMIGSTSDSWLDPAQLCRRPRPNSVNCHRSQGASPQYSSRVMGGKHVEEQFDFCERIDDGRSRHTLEFFSFRSDLMHRQSPTPIDRSEPSPFASRWTRELTLLKALRAVIGRGAEFSSLLFLAHGPRGHEGTTMRAQSHE